MPSASNRHVVDVGRSQSGAALDSRLLGCYATYTGKQHSGTRIIYILYIYIAFLPWRKS